ncbi:hypothetical protein [Pseudomonas putida]|uniref:hypothetical protein n=1 Tax=Pseudomonas putida TaxID=303 RepID=UPI00235BBB0F|nr:hypothetical protein [Pseudomonas putida]GLO43761.1 hypothetical protein PPUN109347_03230 [Pseudomonas putida]HDS0980800.1 hypothetical protein [Pseudomonas putida]
MEKLTRWTNVRTDDLCRVEDPFFSAGIIRDYLQSRGYVQEIFGVTELLKECGLYGSVRLASDQIDRALRPVASGEWMLIRDRPFKPINLEENWYARSCRERGGGDFLINTVSAMSGPGKWKITAMRVNKLASSAAFVANFLTSRGDEGRVFLSSGKDFANTTRTVTQEWVPLDEEEQNFSPSSANHRYGMERKVAQIYVEADDAWDVSGSSWHWRPVIANEEYELKDK